MGLAVNGLLRFLAFVGVGPFLNIARRTKAASATNRAGQTGISGP